VNPAFTEGKTIKTTVSYHPDTPVPIIRGRWMRIPGVFSKKTGSLFPDQEPPLFFGRNAIPGTPGVPHNLLNFPFFTFKGTRLNCTVFFPLKMTCFEK